MNAKKIASELNKTIYTDTSQYVGRNVAAINRTAEFGYIKAFVIEGDLTDVVYVNQLLSLWTAYCLHHGLDVDTNDYDADLAAIWREIVQMGKDTICWGGFESFGLFMCKELV